MMSLFTKSEILYQALLDRDPAYDTDGYRAGLGNLHRRDKWIFCRIFGIMPDDRRDHAQTTQTQTYPSF